MSALNEWIETISISFSDKLVMNTTARTPIYWLESWGLHNKKILLTHENRGERNTPWVGRSRRYFLPPFITMPGKGKKENVIFEKSYLSWRKRAVSTLNRSGDWSKWLRVWVFPGGGKESLVWLTCQASANPSVLLLAFAKVSNFRGNPQVFKIACTSCEWHRYSGYIT